MDKMIAEKVMGFVCYRKIGCERCEPKPYSTDIAAAFQVIEKLWPISLTMKYVEHVPMWACEGMDYRGFCHKEEAETAPLAICLVALKLEQANALP